MGYRHWITSAAVGGLLLVHPALADQEDSDVGHALAGGSVSLNLRYRLEQVDQASFDKDALASTLRTRLTYQSQDFSDFSVGLEFDNILRLGSKTYNSTRNGVTDRPVVADPEGTEVNRAYIEFKGLPDSSLAYGRHRINRDNQRFVGGVGWRQNEQTFDGLLVSNSGLDDIQLDYAYIYNVNRVFGPDDGFLPANQGGDYHLFNGRFTALSPGILSAYAYFMDFDDAPALSNKTVGARFTGDTALSDTTKLMYAGEFASQSDHGNNPTGYSANYYLLEGGFGIDRFTAKLSVEVLEGDAESPDKSFITPLATLHPFQGWADQFLLTPDEGIEDIYLTLGARFWEGQLLVVFHEFNAESGSMEWGTELDVIFNRKFGKRHTGTLKFASYDAKEFSVDTDKVWLMWSAAF